MAMGKSDQSNPVVDDDMKTACGWCQTEIQSEGDLLEVNQEETLELCNDCLIELLPKSLIKPAFLPNRDRENRAAQRYPLTAYVYLLSEKGRRSLCRVTIMNISDTGLKLTLPEAFQPGETVTIGVIGTAVIYKAIVEVIFVNRLNQIEQPVFEMGVHIAGIHQEKKL